jgi:hypothetical protein
MYMWYSGRQKLLIGKEDYIPTPTELYLHHFELFPVCPFGKIGSLSSRTEIIVCHYLLLKYLSKTILDLKTRLTQFIAGNPEKSIQGPSAMPLKFGVYQISKF